MSFKIPFLCNKIILFLLVTIKSPSFPSPASFITSILNTLLIFTVILAFSFLYSSITYFNTSKDCLSFTSTYMFNFSSFALFDFFFTHPHKEKQKIITSIHTILLFFIFTQPLFFIFVKYILRSEERRVG